MRFAGFAGKAAKAFDENAGLRPAEGGKQ